MAAAVELYCKPVLRVYRGPSHLHLGLSFEQLGP